MSDSRGNIVVLAELVYFSVNESKYPSFTDRILADGIFLLTPNNDKNAYVFVNLDKKRVVFIYLCETGWVGYSTKDISICFREFCFRVCSMCDSPKNIKNTQQMFADIEEKYHRLKNNNRDFKDFSGGKYALHNFYEYHNSRPETRMIFVFERDDIKQSISGLKQDLY